MQISINHRPFYKLIDFAPSCTCNDFCGACEYKHICRIRSDS